jgi:CheY-like chemotaxis protein
LHSLIGQLQSGSRHFAGKAGVVALPDVVGDVLAHLRPRLTHGIEVGEAWGEGAQVVLANRDELRQMILHICLNALEAMGDGGRLVFKSERVEVPEEARGPLKLRPTGPFVRLSIVDSGPGMTPDVRQRAFEPFFTTKIGGVGLGLGLSVVYGLVRQLGGWVDLTSGTGAGATVDLFLPVPAQPIEAVAEPPAPQTGRVEGGECLLVIDDEPLVLNFACAYLQHLGYRTVKAENARAAIQIYTQRHAEIDLIVMDLSLPDLPGQDLLGRLRGIRADAKVVVSSGLDMETLAELSRQPGVRGTLKKPYRGETLGIAIREALDR